MASKSARYRAKLKAKKRRERLRKGSLTKKGTAGKRLKFMGLTKVRRIGGIPR